MLHKAKYFSTLFMNVTFLFLIFFITIHFSSSKSKHFPNFSNNFNNQNSQININQILDENIGCKGIQKYHNRHEKCSYVKSHMGCQSKGYISYLQLFYCTFSPNLGYTLLVIWLLVLFYLLGDTARNYFCESLEGLSRNLKLTPTVAGITLLALGNGAPDVFGSIISFTGDGSTKDIGVNSILGGAFFISSVVVGIISISISNQGRQISSSSFIGNVFFLLFILSCLLAIIIIGKINFWGALSFLSLYFIYAAVIFASESYAKRERIAEVIDKSLLLPVTILENSPQEESTELEEVPMLGFLEGDDDVQISASCFFKNLLWILEMPLDLPRKLTIPIFSEEKWSKLIAIISTALAPVLLASIWNLHYPKTNLLVYGLSESAGLGSAIFLFCTSDRFNPPRSCQLPWLLESFLMSITWTYILAQELISLLVSLGTIFGISHSVTGLLVLAWGNSIGDLFSNVTIAQNGGPCGAQIAISGCYASSIFNIIVGLGLSLVLASWAVYPSSFDITSEPTIYETFGFLIMGLIWAFVVLTKRKMKVDKLLGYGLLLIYLCFLVLKLARTFGLVQFHLFPSHFNLKTWFIC